jgi:hypothetical protein
MITRKRQTCMRNFMKVEKVKDVCSKWKEVIFAYPNEKRAWCYVLMYKKIVIRKWH